MADRQFNVGGVQTAPADWLLPASLEIIPKMAFASFDGSGAGGTFLPCLRIISDSGHVAGEAVVGTSVAAGGSADVTWFPWWRGITSVPPPPSPLGTLWLWYDFADASTVTLDGSGKIASIADKSKNGHDASQGTAALRPSVGTLNGNNCGLFASASGTILTSTGWAAVLPQPFTVLCVWTQTVAASANYQPGPYGGSLSPPPAILFDNFNNSLLVAQQGATGVSRGLAAPYTQQQATSLYNGASSYIRLNAVQSSGSVDVDPMSDFCVGASHFTSSSPPVVQLMDGAVGEILVYQGALSASQLAGAESYLKSKWGTP